MDRERGIISAFLHMIAYDYKVIIIIVIIEKCTACTSEFEFTSQAIEREYFYIILWKQFQYMKKSIKYRVRGTGSSHRVRAYLY